MSAPPDLRADSREAARRLLVRLITAFYLALLGEGVLRKWIVPDASNALVFLRDPLIVLIVATHLRLGPSAVSRRAAAIGGAALIAFGLCAGLQAATSDLAPPVLLAGLRNYFLFVPLSFAIRDAYTAKDYRDWIRLNLALATPVAVLVALQYAAPPTAAINAVPGGGHEGVFLVVEDVVRPYGLFSFSLGHSAYAAWMAGVALAVLAGLRFPPWLSGPGLAGIAIMGLLSGSRTYVMFSGAVAVCFVAVAAVFGSNRARTRALGAAAGFVVLATAAMVVLPGPLADLATRQTTAEAAEGSTVERILEVGTGFVAEAGRVPLFGLGFGAGTNVAAYLATGSTGHVLAEYELTRIVQELGPMFGGLYILLRWSFLAWLSVLTLRAASRGNLQPACFLGFLVPIFLAHDLTLQNTMIGIGWFAAGVLMSAERVGGAFASAPAGRARRHLGPRGAFA